MVTDNEVARLRSLGINSPGAGGLGATTSIEHDVVDLILTGTAETADRPVLGNLLEQLHGAVLDCQVRQVRVDLRLLKFMTSSCFKDFVTWLSRIVEVEENHRYRVHFRSNPAVRWQRTSLHALASFAVDVVTFE